MNIIKLSFRIEIKVHINQIPKYGSRNAHKLHERKTCEHFFKSQVIVAISAITLFIRFICKEFTCHEKFTDMARLNQTKEEHKFIRQ